MGALIMDKDIIQELGDVFDQHLLQQLRDGNVDHQTLNVIRQRLKDCGVSSDIEDLLKASPADRALSAARRKNSDGTQAKVRFTG
jgi:hypothetical protein